MGIATRSHFVNLTAACILSGGLIAAATIDSHRPVAAPVSGGVAAPCTSAFRFAPPITQESAQNQFRTQVLAAPNLHTYTYKGIKHTLSDVNVYSTTYSAKDVTATDSQYGFEYQMVWQPTMPSGGPKGGTVELINDGFGHFSGEVSIEDDLTYTPQSAVVKIQ